MPLKTVSCFRTTLIRSAILLSLFAVNKASAGPQASVTKSSTQPQPPAAPSAPVTTLPPAALEQMPALPPNVGFSNGLLTIVSENSTLGDILRAVQAQTGAALEMPEEVTERVAIKLGPAPAREVLAALMNGTKFNYVVLGSASSPNQLDRLIVTPSSTNVLSGGNRISVSKPQARVKKVVPVDDGGETAANTVSDEERQNADILPPGANPQEPPQQLPAASGEQGQEQPPTK